MMLLKVPIVYVLCILLHDQIMLTFHLNYGNKKSSLRDGLFKIACKDPLGKYGYVAQASSQEPISQFLEKIIFSFCLLSNR